MIADPDFWNDGKRAALEIKKQKNIETHILAAQHLSSLKEDVCAASELAHEDTSFFQEAVQLLLSFEKTLEDMELSVLLSGEFDDHDAILSIQAGAGGTESCDWALMLSRMYSRFCHNMGWNTEELSVSSGEGAGIKSVECRVSAGAHGKVFGYLKAEDGIHRLIRISPFDSAGRRHTSFASVSVTPMLDDHIDIDIQPQDIRIDTYRASGAGGQHVNKTDSAVRITHHPSGIVVQCQSERSQHQNKERCMQLLSSKLYAFERAKQDKQKQAAQGEQFDISFGSQIRTYTLYPFKLVKDHRSNYETSDASSVLDGDLKEFIKRYNLQSAKKHISPIT